MVYKERTYRKNFRQSDLVHFQVVIKETDLDIGVYRKRYSPELVKLAEKITLKYRTQLEEYIKIHPEFLTSLQPLQVKSGAPAIARQMADAAKKAGVGPMAAVAGAVAEAVGMELLRHTREIIIENGGDIYLKSNRKRRIGIYAGQSPFTEKIAIEIPPELTPLGICTSSGTVGHSLSFGRADAAIIISANTSLADAVATATANRVQNPEDVQTALEFAINISGITGAVVIKHDKLAAWGNVKIVHI
ncbi:UPF0280 family protein [Desulfolucanica intricata]|uniref:UPF0280 family protein n=1 Tax=Desulfolucanica intricata TaxID=1285191 RepID=UPI00083528BA|nr:UPF0280 family protein [Desulfolucanica intricata]